MIGRRTVVASAGQGRPHNGWRPDQPRTCDDNRRTLDATKMARWRHQVKSCAMHDGRAFRDATRARRCAGEPIRGVRSTATVWHAARRRGAPMNRDPRGRSSSVRSPYVVAPLPPYPPPYPPDRR